MSFTTKPEHGKAWNVTGFAIKDLVNGGAGGGWGEGDYIWDLPMMRPLRGVTGVLRSLGMCALQPAPYIHTVTGSRDTMVLFGVPTQQPGD